MNVEIDTLNFSIDYFVNRRCTPQWNLVETVMDFHNLMFLYEGMCDFYINGKLYKLEKGDVIYAPHGSRRKANTYKENLMQCYALSFHTNIDPDEIPILPPLIKAGMDDELLLLFSQMDHTWLVKSDGYQLKCRALLMMIIYKLLHLSNNNNGSNMLNARFSKVKQYISEHITENLTVADLAEFSGLNPVYFGNMFRKYTGVTVKEYMNRLRIGRACDFLGTGGCTVKEAAYQSGFDDIFYFSKVFKRITGVPPSSYK